MRQRQWFALAGAILVLALVGGGLRTLDREIARRAERVREPETGMVVEARDGAMLRAFAASDGRWRLPATERDVDARFLRMLEGWEDKRFRSHAGIDAIALVRSAWSSARHGRLVSGGSTLTMQAARLLDRLPTGSWRAKGEQFLGALALERALGKDGILDLYLRLAPYGGNIEGVRAASLAWFGHEPRRLTAGEAALLVALPQSPERLRPDLHPDRARAARDRVLARMAQIRVLSPEEAHHGMAEPIPTRRREMPMLAAHAAQAARDRALAAHDTRAPRLTIDAALQSRLEAYARETVAGLPVPESLAILVSDHRTGEVLASVGSPNLLDAARDGHVDLTLAPRSPGSTLKPLIYGIAFERGVAHPESLMDDRPRSFAGYTPDNFDHLFEGTLTARRALQLSRNLPAVELLSAVGPSRLVDRMRRAGAAPELGSRTLPGLAIGLGGVGLSLADLVRIYGGIAHGGVAAPLHIGAAPAGREGIGSRILSEPASWYLASILAGAPSTVKASPGTIAWKTGTSFGYRDAWTLAFDGRHVVGVWLGRPDGAPVPGLIGQEAAVPVMRDVFARIGPPVPLPAPPPGILADISRLPPAMRRIEPSGPAGGSTDAPEIVFPPRGAHLELAGGNGDLALKLRSGRPPFTWYIDGRPTLTGLYAREAIWRPREPGFVTISVVDARGAAATTRVFVD
ncbi:penicillin-binding protein 1C [Aureimonas jatrophae]|uniref:peptidoglycan glycosyltransferase n=1 Tax=Aureimonas jatrophae TaxID=1166073 RepID=A0A1H0C5Q7_9HYPH|nr:penicillin-binding protein 1C [Aureimonas jatrophae]MBB3949079.1 penicillin-binding protein 1C [Aureimonas jatrophae]SDN53192.1 penicillin-binding protein 1C [Aureimonas jatrophae]